MFEKPKSLFLKNLNVVVFVLGFNVPPTAKVIRRRAEKSGIMVLLSKTSGYVFTIIILLWRRHLVIGTH